MRSSSSVHSRVSPPGIPIVRAVDRLGSESRCMTRTPIELSSDGSWHHFVARDATSLVEARGIGHEGFASPGITVPMVPGQVPLQLIGMAAPFAEH